VPDVDAGLRCTRPARHDLSQTLDASLIAEAEPALSSGRSVQISAPVHNTDRTVGTMLGSEVTRRVGPEGLPPGTIDLALTGTAGQSLGAFLPAGIRITLAGDANDYVGKGLSGGVVVVRPDPDAGHGDLPQVIAGNTIGYGATSGELYLRGTVGERFAVRNSGALMVCEGAGDHALEYMTGGRAIILGPTGRNVAAGMSGGIGYLLDAPASAVNPELVDVGGLDEAEAAFIGRVLVDHVALTGSTIAASLLADWPTAAARFTRVLPRDYARVLAVQAGAAAAGTDPDAVNGALMESIRG
jgi:glutamate synthase (NADPH/NADH) large chain